jgi:GTPase
MRRAPALPPAARAVLRRDRSALARLISAVEDGDPTAVPVLRALYPHTGKARIVGFTGPLGVGKSSVINALLSLLRQQGHRVGVVAVDPSSPFTGGSVLGDRIRLDRAKGDAGIFVRSMASRGHAGGIAAATRAVTRLLDAFGMDVVLVETVGSGQVDIEIREVASTSVVVLVPHLGDEVQSLKAGLFEIADVFCINKADLPGADAASRDLIELGLLVKGRPGWNPRIVLTSTVEGRGMESLWQAVGEHERYLDSSRERTTGDRRRLEGEILSLVRERVGLRLSDALRSDPQLSKLLDRVLQRRLDPYGAADRLYSELDQHL